MIITVRTGELVKTLEFSAKEAGELRLTAGGKYKSQIDEFLLSFFTDLGVSKHDAISELVVQDVPLVIEFDSSRQIGKVLLTDKSWLMESNSHFEPSLIRYPDGKMELIAISLVVDKEKSHDKS